MTARVGAGLLVLAALFVAEPAQAFRCTRTSPEVGPSLVWGVRKVSWWLGSEVAALAGGQGRSEAEASFSTWTDPECTDLRFPLEGVRADLRSEYISGQANQNVVVLPEVWPYDAGTLAITTSAYDTKTGILLDVDIELNGESFRFDRVDDAQVCEGVTDLRNTLTHEIGHLIGLDHPPATARFSETTMFARAVPCETMKRSLAADDIEGVCAIYPAGARTQPCFPPDELGFRVVGVEEGYGCRSTRPSGFVWIGGALLGLLLLRRRT